MKKKANAQPVQHVSIDIIQQEDHSILQQLSLSQLNIAQLYAFPTAK
jgi:hypothetical protein